MVRWKFKKCPRCSGDLFLDREPDGWYEQCLQCGYLNAKPASVRVGRYSEKREREVVQVVS